MATRKYAYCQEPSKIILPLTAQRICAISSSRDKNSCHSFAKLSAWWLAPLAVCRKSPLLSLRAQAWQSRGSGMMYSDVHIVSFRFNEILRQAQDDNKDGSLSLVFCRKAVA